MWYSAKYVDMRSSNQTKAATPLRRRNLNIEILPAAMAAGCRNNVPARKRPGNKRGKNRGNIAAASRKRDKMAADSIFVSNIPLFPRRTPGFGRLPPADSFF